MQLSRYYGPLIDNFQLKDEKFSTAVEVAAGNALFHVIVEDDATAAELIRRLSKDKLGRLTFMPLRQLHVKAAEYVLTVEVGMSHNLLLGYLLTEMAGLL